MMQIRTSNERLGKIPKILPFAITGPPSWDDEKFAGDLRGPASIKATFP